MSNVAQWQECLTPEQWDQELARLGNHPLQSALWGNARQKTDGIGQLLLEYREKDGEVNGLARVEERPVAFLGRVAWLPKGPVLPYDDDGTIEAQLRAELKQRGFIAYITDRYAIPQTTDPQGPKTIWLDLTIGLEALSKGLDSQWRYGAGRALREGVIVRTTTEQAEVSAFFQLCSALSANKGFILPASEALMQELIQSTLSDGGVGVSLYVGDVGGVIAGGAAVVRSGCHLHYLWGASDRRFSKFRVSEAIHWQVIQDGVAAGMRRYDLEGIDPAGNPGVYRFKRKMGGNEVALEGVVASPLSLVGRIALSVGRRLGKL